MKIAKSLAVAAAVGLLCTGGAALASTSSAPGAAPVRHVFVLVLENEGYSSTFGSPVNDPYLAETLPREGALLTQYYATGHVSNDNYVSMVSGQGPNPQNQSDCQYYTDFVGTGPEVDGQAIGTGCVFPSSVETIGNQLSTKGLSWKGYMEDMGNVPSREAPVCGHPALNSQDKTQSAVAGDGYVGRHDPFIYFHSIIDDQTYCNDHVVPLGSISGALPKGTPPGTTGLATDLKSLATTPNLSFITPNVCDDGHDYPCTNQPSGASALADIDTFLHKWVPLITSSPAYKQNGLLVITFDEGSDSDGSSCCNEQPGPNTPLPGISGIGGGLVGAVLLSRFITPGTVSITPYNHYSLLASIEDFFGVARLGYAATTSSTFGTDIFNK